MAPASSVDIEAILGSDASLLTYQSKTIPASRLHLPGPDFVERIFTPTDRSPRVLGGLQGLFDHGRLVTGDHVEPVPAAVDERHQGQVDVDDVVLAHVLLELADRLVPDVLHATRQPRLHPGCNPPKSR